MKTITVFATWPPNADTKHSREWRVSPVDPDEGVALEKRTSGSGYAVPVTIEVPDEVEAAESKHDEPSLFFGDTMLALHWHEDGHLVTAWPACQSKPPKEERMKFQVVRSQ